MKNDLAFHLNTHTDFQIAKQTHLVIVVIVIIVMNFYMRTCNCTRLGEKNWSVAEERTKPNETQIIKINISIIVYHEDQSKWNKKQPKKEQNRT